MVEGRIEWHRVGAVGLSRKRRVTTKQRVRSKIYNLSHDISALRQEIQELTTLRAVLYTRALYTRYDGDGSLVSKTREFMTLMRHGYRTNEARTRDCLYAVLDDEVKFGPRAGRDKLLAISDHYLAKFQSIEFTFEEVHVVARDPTAETCTIRVEGQISGAIDDETFAKTPLALLGVPNQVVVVRASVDLYFDGRGCILRNDVCVDYAALHAAVSSQAVKAAEVTELQDRNFEGSVCPIEKNALLQKKHGSVVENSIEEDAQDFDEKTRSETDDRHSVRFLLT